LDQRKVRVWLTGWATLLGALLFLPTLHANSDTSGRPNPNALRRQARELADQGDWSGAFAVYLRIPRTDRDKAEYQEYLRHVLQVRRLRDKSSQVLVGRLQPDQALAVYQTVLEKLQRRYVDRDKVTLGKLFLNGLQELRSALEDESFLKEHMSGASLQGVEALKDRLQALRDREPVIDSPKEASEQLHGVMLACRPLGLKPAAVMLEFLCGACNALDEYTAYLSPRQLLEIEADLNGKYVGIGVDLGVADQKLIITRVLPNSPAEQARLTDGRALTPGTSIVSIDGQTVDSAAPAAAASRLLGEEGTKVQLEVVPYGDSKPQPLKVERRLVEMLSVEPPIEIPGPMGERTGIGYVRITSFQKTTPQELRSAILQLQSQTSQMGGPGLSKLIIDLRGNPGGSFPAALQVAELFLSEGVIVYTQTRLKVDAYRASNSQAFTMPLCLLVDGETASAAEVVAGALKENGRATLYGQTTYGKCSIQCTVKLESIKSGIQITVARFVSPAHESYDGHGVTPHQFVERGSMMGDLQLNAAVAGPKLMMPR
jgi:carboxyl-terminal processing protease